MFIVSSLKKGGPVNQLSYLIAGLDKRLFSIHVISLSNEPVENMADYFQTTHKVSYTNLQLGRLASLFKATDILKRYIAQHGIEVVHCCGLRADIFSAGLNRSVPCVSTIHCELDRCYKAMFGKLKGELIALIHARSLRKKWRCFCVSDAVKQHVKKRYGLNNCATIRNGTDSDKYYPVAAEEKARLREQLNIPPDKRVWLTSVSRDYHKNAEFVADEFKSILTTSDNDYLIFIGENAVLDKSKAILADCKNVMFAGRVSCVNHYMQAADFYLSASETEGLPNAVLEALASGLPVLLSDIGPHAEIAKYAAQSAVLFGLHAPQMFRQKIACLTQRNYEELSAAAREITLNEFGCDLMAKRHQDAYLSLCRP